MMLLGTHWIYENLGENNMPRPREYDYLIVKPKPKPNSGEKECPICSSTLKYLKELKLDHKIKIISKDSQIGQTLVTEFNIIGTPTFIFRDGCTFTGGWMDLDEKTKGRLRTLMDRRIPGRLKRDKLGF